MTETPDDYEHGQINGETKATMKGLAHSMDVMRAQITDLRCSEHRAKLSSLRTHIYLQWAIILLLLGGNGATAYLMLRLYMAASGGG